MARTRTRARKPQRRTAQVQTEEQALSLRKYDPIHLDCRDLKHAWQKKGYYRTPEGMVRRVLVCMRCGADGRDEFTPNMTRNRPRRYLLPDGYRIGRLEQVEVRAESIRRARVYRSESEMLRAVFNGNGKNGKNGNGKKN